MTDMSSGLSADEFKKVETAINDSIKTSGLVDKGIGIIKASTKNKDKINEITAKEFNKGIMKFFPNNIKNLPADSFVEQTIEGKNAFYASASKQMVIPGKGQVFRSSTKQDMQ